RDRPRLADVRALERHARPGHLRHRAVEARLSPVVLSTGAILPAVPTRPLVSVVTPTLNQARFLERTLASVRGQTYPNIEHIVVDGGSTDGALEILERERRAGTLRTTSGPDAGMYDAVNKGLGMATGEVLAYLNSDDAWLPWAVERVMQVFESKPSVD